MALARVQFLQLVWSIMGIWGGFAPRLVFGLPGQQSPQGLKIEWVYPPEFVTEAAVALLRTDHACLVRSFNVSPRFFGDD